MAKYHTKRRIKSQRKTRPYIFLPVGTCMLFVASHCPITYLFFFQQSYIKKSPNVEIGQMKGYGLHKFGCVNGIKYRNCTNQETNINI